MRYTFIRNHREAFPVTLLCEVLEVGTSGFYAWLQRPESPRSRETLGGSGWISRLCLNAVGRPYGSPRIHAALRANRDAYVPFIGLRHARHDLDDAKTVDGAGGPCKLPRQAESWRVEFSGI